MRRASLCRRSPWALAAPARAQVADPVDVGGGVAEAVPERPGLFRAGSFYLTPYLHVGTLGIDTNVFYTPTDRQTDFIASGGPGLEIVRPIGKESRFRLDGAVDYLWFARTESQRRFNGHGSALLDLKGVKTHFVVEERYATSYSRPNYQVNERVQQETEGTEGVLDAGGSASGSSSRSSARAATRSPTAPGLPRHGPRPRR